MTIDNSSNAAPVFVKLYDQERRSNVRYLYILANDKLTVEQLSAGKYEVRYQAVGPGQDNCGGSHARRCLGIGVSIGIVRRRRRYAESCCKQHLI